MGVPQTLGSSYTAPLIACELQRRSAWITSYTEYRHIIMATKRAHFLPLQTYILSASKQDQRAGRYGTCPWDRVGNLSPAPPLIPNFSCCQDSTPQSSSLRYLLYGWSQRSSGKLVQCDHIYCQVFNFLSFSFTRLNHAEKCQFSAKCFGCLGTHTKTDKYIR